MSFHRACCCCGGPCGCNATAEALDPHYVTHADVAVSTACVIVYDTSDSTWKSLKITAVRWTDAAALALGDPCTWSGKVGEADVDIYGAVPDCSGAVVEQATVDLIGTLLASGAWYFDVRDNRFEMAFFDPPQDGYPCESSLDPSVFTNAITVWDESTGIVGKNGTATFQQP